MFVTKAKENKDLVIVLSGYVTDVNGTQDCIMIKNDVITERSDLNSALEEADCHIIPHVAKAVECGFERIIVASNDSDVLIYNLAYFDAFKKVNACELWIRFGIGENTRNSSC